METNPILGVFIIHAVVVCTNTGNPRSCKDKTSWKARTAKYNTKWRTYKHTATCKADWAIWYKYTEWRTTASGSANTSITDRPMWENCSVSCQCVFLLILRYKTKASYDLISMSINTGIRLLNWVSQWKCTNFQTKKADNRGMSLHTRLPYASVGTMALSSALNQCDSKSLK